MVSVAYECSGLGFVVMAATANNSVSASEECGDSEVVELSSCCLSLTRAEVPGECYSLIVCVWYNSVCSSDVCGWSDEVEVSVWTVPEACCESV